MIPGSSCLPPRSRSRCRWWSPWPPQFPRRHQRAMNRDDTTSRSAAEVLRRLCRRDAGGRLGGQRARGFHVCFRGTHLPGLVFTDRAIGVARHLGVVRGAGHEVRSQPRDARRPRVGLDCPGSGLERAGGALDRWDITASSVPGGGDESVSGGVERAESTLKRGDLLARSPVKPRPRLVGAVLRGYRRGRGCCSRWAPRPPSRLPWRWPPRPLWRCPGARFGGRRRARSGGGPVPAFTVALVLAFALAVVDRAPGSATFAAVLPLPAAQPIAPITSSRPSAAIPAVSRLCPRATPGGGADG